MRATTPPTSAVGFDDDGVGPRVNHLIDGVRYMLHLGNKNLEVTVLTVEEKQRDHGWYVSFLNHKAKKILLELDTFFDNARMIDTAWLEVGE